MFIKVITSSRVCPNIGVCIISGKPGQPANFKLGIRGNPQNISNINIHLYQCNYNVDSFLILKFAFFS